MKRWLGFPEVKQHRGLNLEDLPLNHAYVIVNTTIEQASVYSVSDDCFNCPYKLVKDVQGGKEESWEVNTSVLQSWRILKTGGKDFIERDNRRGLLCQMRPTFHEYGVYRLDVGKCEVKPEVPPVNTYLPLLICGLLVLLVCSIYTFLHFMVKRNKKYNEILTDKNIQIKVNKSSINERTLFVFRGIILCMITFLTTGGGGYPLFSNRWGGLNTAECLFFAYIWSIGVNIPTVINKAFSKKTKCAIIGDVFVRSFFLILLGIVIDSAIGNHRHDKYSLWCPLQRMGLAYFLVASAYVLTVQRFEMKSKKTICKAIGNLVSLLWCWIITGFLLAIFIILIATFISFNCLSKTSLETYKDYTNIKLDLTQNCNNGITEYANKLFVAENESMVDVNGYIGFCKGIMGVMSTIIYTMIGLKAGVVYLHHQTHSDRLKLWGLWATLFGLGGIFFAVMSYLVEFNLWPVSSMIVLSTATLYFFMIVYVITDVFKIHSWVLTSAGVTSLVLLCGHELFSFSVPFNWNLHFRSHIMFSLQNVWCVFLWLMVGLLFMKRKIRFLI